MSEPRTEAGAKRLGELVTGYCDTTFARVTDDSGHYCARCGAVIPKGDQAVIHTGKPHHGYGSAFSGRVLCRDCIEHVCPLIVPRGRR